MTAAIYLILALPMGMLALKRSQTQFKTPARVSA
jgi:hypothetical protein